MAETSAVGASASAAPANSVVDPKQSQQTDGEKKPPAVAEVPDFRKHKHKLKINEKEQELDYDTVVKLAQKGASADEVFRKASAKEKQLAGYIDRAKQGDLGWLEELAGDEQMAKWAEKKLLKIIELQEMSPEKRDFLKEKARREQLENDLKSRDERERDAQMETIRGQAAQEIDVKIDEAFKAARLPMTPSRIERVAQYLDASLSTEGALLDPAKALARVQTEMRSDAREVLESLSPAELREFLPKKVLDAIRKGDIEDARSADPMRRSTQNGQARPLSDAKQKRMSTDDYFTKLEKKFGG